LNLFDLIQATLAPVVLISAVGLINLSLYNRYGRVHDRIRHLLHDIDALTLAKIPEEIRKRKTANANIQIRLLFERGRLLKWSLLLMQFSLVISVADAIFIFMDMIESIQLEIVIVMTFGLAVLLILISAILTAIEISKSLKVLSIEIETVIKN
jgi:hypothetical protein